MSLSDYALDVDRVENGAWMSLDDNMDINVISLTSKSGKKAVKKHEEIIYGSGFRANKKKQAGKKDDEVLRRTFAYDLIVGWRGEGWVLNDEKVTFSREQCIELFMDDKYRPLYSEVLSRTIDNDVYFEEQQEKDIERGNDSSDGKNDTEAD